MKTPSNDLFILIKSLNSQEKRCFKLFAQNASEESNYFKLFDAIDSLKEYDEKKLLNKLNKTIEIKELKYLKSYLQESIFKFLEHHYSEFSVDMQLQRYLQRIQILFGKGLFDLAEKTIAKAEKLALENHKDYYRAIILSLKRDKMVLEANIEEINKYPHGPHQEELKCLEALINTLQYSKLHIQSISPLYTEAAFPESKKSELIRLKEEPLLMDESKALSFSAKMLYYTVRGHLSDLSGNEEESWSHYRKIVQLMEENPSYLNSNIESYVMRVHNLLIITMRLRKDEEVSLCYNKLHRFIAALPSKSQSNSILNIYTSIKNNYIAYLLLSFDIAEALKQSEQLRPSVKKEQNLQCFLIFHYNLFFIYFYLNDFHNALQQINEICNTRESGMREDVIRFARMLNLVIHYELGNEEMLPGLARSTASALSKKKPLAPEEELLLNFFGKIIYKAPEKKERIEALKALQEELRAKKISLLCGDFDCLSWAQSKIEGRPLLEIMREKVPAKEVLR